MFNIYLIFNTYLIYKAISNDNAITKICLTHTIIKVISFFIY